MPILTTTAADAALLAAAFKDPTRLVVACLCAAWCDTCEEFKATFQRLAGADPASTYVWIDIEDDSALVGEVDVENFPTLAVFRGGQTLFHGVSLPQQGVVARTISAVAQGAPARDVPGAVRRLPAALSARAP